MTETWSSTSPARRRQTSVRVWFGRFANRMPGVVDISSGGFLAIRRNLAMWTSVACYCITTSRPGRCTDFCPAQLYRKNTDDEARAQRSASTSNRGRLRPVGGFVCLLRSDHACHILPPSEIDWGLFWVAFTGSKGKYQLAEGTEYGNWGDCGGVSEQASDS